MYLSGKVVNSTNELLGFIINRKSPDEIADFIEKSNTMVESNLQKNIFSVGRILNYLYNESGTSKEKLSVK